MRIGEIKINSKEQLVDFIDRGNKVKYIFFWGHQKKEACISKSCFSQWYPSEFEENNKKFITAEHYMMYHKARMFGDVKACKKILTASSPGEAKAIGREVVGFEQKLWDGEKVGIVINANLAKFSQNPELAEFLLKTQGRVLVEASPVDKIWGIGLSEDRPKSGDPSSWKGLNLLGFALMSVRDQLAGSL